MNETLDENESGSSLCEYIYIFLKNPHHYKNTDIWAGFSHFHLLGTLFQVSSFLRMRFFFFLTFFVSKKTRTKRNHWDEKWCRERMDKRGGGGDMAPEVFRRKSARRGRALFVVEPLSHFIHFFFLCVRLFHPLKQEEERGEKGGSSTPRLDDPRFVPLHGTAVNRSRHKLLGEEKKKWLAAIWVFFFHVATGGPSLCETSHSVGLQTRLSSLVNRVL